MSPAGLQKRLAGKSKHSILKFGMLWLPQSRKLFDQLMWLQTFGNHLEVNAYHSCVKVEVEAFAMWLQEQHQKQIQAMIVLEKTISESLFATLHLCIK